MTCDGQVVMVYPDSLADVINRRPKTTA